MNKLYIILCAAMLALAGCGGGGGGSSSGGSSSSDGGSSSEGNGGSSGGENSGSSSGEPSGGLTLAPDCSGANCGSSGDSYTGSGVGIWYAVNKENSDQIIDIKIRKLSGQKVYYAYTNWGTSKQKLSNSTSLKPLANRTFETAGSSVSESKTAGSFSASSLAIQQKPASGAKTHTWTVLNLLNQNGYSTPTALKGQASLGSATVYVWVADTLWASITDTHVDAVLDRFAGRNGRKSIYSLGRQWVGEPWGGNASNWNNLMSGNEKDIHIVITEIQPDGYVGYFYPGNNFKKSSAPLSNEALVLFMDASELLSTTSGGTWNPLSKQVLNAFSTVAHEFEHMIFYYEKSVSRAAGAHEAEEWLNELAAAMFQFYYLAADQKDLPQADGPEYLRLSQWVGKPVCPLDTWTGSEQTSSSCNIEADYGKVGSLAAYLLRHYGSDMIKDIVQNSSLGIEALESAAKKQGTSLADILRRWGASLAIDGVDVPKYYGFPRTSVDGAEYAAFDVKTLGQSRQIYSSLPSSIEPKTTAVVYKGVKNGVYTHQVKLPPKTSLTVIVQW